MAAATHRNHHRLFKKNNTYLISISFFRLLEFLKFMFCFYFTRSINQSININIYIHVIFTHVTHVRQYKLFFYFIFFTSCMKKPKCKAKTCDNKWLVCMLSLFWSGLRKNCWKSLTHVLCFMLQTNKAIIIRWLQPQPSQKVVTSIYVIGWKLLSFLPFPCAYKAKLTTWISDDMMMRFKFPGRAHS